MRPTWTGIEHDLEQFQTTSFQTALVRDEAGRTKQRLGNADGWTIRHSTPVANGTVVNASLVAGLLNDPWLVRLCGLILGYFPYRVTFKR